MTPARRLLAALTSRRAAIARPGSHLARVEPDVDEGLAGRHDGSGMYREHDPLVRAHRVARRLSPQIVVVTEHGADLQPFAAPDGTLEEPALHGAHPREVREVGEASVIRDRPP